MFMELISVELGLLGVRAIDNGGIIKADWQFHRDAAQKPRGCSCRLFRRRYCCILVDFVVKLPAVPVRVAKRWPEQ